MTAIVASVTIVLLLLIFIVPVVRFKKKMSGSPHDRSKRSIEENEFID